VIIAFLEGSKGEIDLMPLMLKRLTITGSTMRPRTLIEKTALRDALLTNIWPGIASGELRPHVHQRFPLADAAAAHRLMESSHHIGKIVLDVKS
jgi:NADPH:quinone reductase-like Zn-dependent oxidoreductase